MLFSLLIYCPLAHWTWHPDGFLRKWGVLDFAGGTVVHMSAGFAALAGAMVLGRRKSHLANEAHDPANIPFVLLGTGMLWFGWFGFNAGSALAANGTAAMAFATTNTASATAMLGWMFFDWMMGKKPSALGACIGAVVGLVAITPAAGFVTIRESIVIGLVASVISNLAVSLRTKSTLDDTLDVFPCHGVGGMVGMLATGIFAAKVGLTSGQTTTFMYHCIALVIVAAFSFFGSLILYKVTDLIIPLRVDRGAGSGRPRPQPARRDGPRHRPPRRCPYEREGEGRRPGLQRSLTCPPIDPLPPGEGARRAGEGRRLRIKQTNTRMLHPVRRPPYDPDLTSFSCLYLPASRSGAGMKTFHNMRRCFSSGTADGHRRRRR